MATIRGVIQIQDQMSPALRAMNNALNICISSFESMQSVSGNAVDVSSLQAAQRELQNAEISVNEVENSIDAARDSQENFSNEIQNSGNAMNGLIAKAKGLVATYLGIQTAKAAMAASDELVQTKARLDLMNDGLQTTDQLQNMIFQSAQRSRAEYSSVAANVARLGTVAKDAFKTNEETVAFAEQLNKQFVLCGASAQEAAAVSLQISQALGSGVLRGDELNSVFEQAPTIVQSIADYLNVPIGKIREMASEGQITADIVKKAMFASADDVNKKFESMPKTLGQIWTQIKNNALMSFQPVLLKINEVVNNPGFNTLASNISIACGVISIVLLDIINLVCSVAQFFSDNWGIIGPIIYGIVAALGLYLVIMGLVNLSNLASAASAGIASLAADMYGASLMFQSGATFSATVAQYGLNGALLACPVTWIILAIIAIIVAIYAVVGAINKVQGTSISATGVICGALAAAGAFIWNLFVALLKMVFGMVESWYNLFGTFANFFGNVFNDPISSIIHLFEGLADNVLGIIQKIAEAIDAVFGSNLSSAVQGWRGNLSTLANNAAKKYGNGSYQEKVQQLDIDGILDNLGVGLDRISYKGAYNAGYNWGADKEAGIKNMFSGFDMNNLGGGSPFNYDDLLKNAEGANKGAGDTAKNTGAMKDKLDVTEEDLKYLKDIAEQEVINRFTTAEIKVDMVNHNTINNDMDIDGVCNALNDKVEEAMNTSAEGVHE